jgi:cell division septation protein DedD
VIALPAYLVEPSPSEPEAPYRVRMGPFPSRAAAEAAGARLAKGRGQKLWVIKER